MSRRTTQPVDDAALLHDDEGGYVLIVSALMLIVLMVAAALTVDVGLFFSRANQVQRAADSAALAGVVYMPTNFAGAEQAALDTAKRNGFDDADPDISVDVQPGSTPRRLNVTVQDSRVETIFGKVVTESIRVTRSAVGEYVQQIPMGSAYNAIGTGYLPGYSNMPGAGGKQNFWLAVNGYCTAKEEGDQRLSAADGNRDDGEFPTDAGYKCFNQQTGGGWDPDMVRNTEYATQGYDYIVKVPCKVTGNGHPEVDAASPCALDVAANHSARFAIYDPNYVQKRHPDYDFPLPPAQPVSADNPTVRTHVPEPQHLSTSQTTVTTVVTVYVPDGTPYKYDDDVAVASYEFSTCTKEEAESGSCKVKRLSGNSGSNNATTADAGDWFELYNMRGTDPAGRWRISVRTVKEPHSYGINTFALRAWTGGPNSFTLCDARSAADTCPQVSGDTAMSVSTLAQRSDSQEVEAEFFFARLAPKEEFAGKQVSITLWDVGEFATSIELLRPGATTGEKFSYRTLPPGLETVSGNNLNDQLVNNFTTPSAILDVDGDATSSRTNFTPQGVQRTNGVGLYNGRKLELRVAIPADYDPDLGGHDGWWRIRYTIPPGNTERLFSDRTTWTVSLLGDPVHLVHE